MKRDDSLRTFKGSVAIVTGASMTCVFSVVVVVLEKVFLGCEGYPGNRCVEVFGGVLVIVAGTAGRGPVRA
jgi:hypothetical protein